MSKPHTARKGSQYEVTVPTVGDRIVMAAVKIVLEPIFQADFHPVSLGFRPKRSTQQALEAVRVAANQGRLWVLDADVKACFDTIDHDPLIAQVGRRVVDRRMIKLLRRLRAGVLLIGTPPGGGQPAGFANLPPMLANIALHVLDEAWLMGGQRLGQLVRYCDDFVVLCPTRERAEQARELATQSLGPLGLHLHPDRTQILCLRQGGQGFDFLGFHHRMVASRKRPGRF